MPCGCKKGAGMYVHGGGFKRKKRRRKKGRKGRKGAGFAEALFNPFGAAMRGLVGGYSRLGGRMPGSKYSGLAQRFKGAALGRKRGSGRATFLSGATWHGYPKGSGMGFSGSGMSWTGSGLRGKRIAFRKGSGRRVV